MPYIQSIGASYRFFWAAVQHETRSGSTSYNQFNNSGTFAEMPNYGAPDGWGICQLEGADTESTYNWRVNVEQAKQVLVEKREAQQRFFDSVARTYPADPEAQTPPSAFVHPGTATPMTALEAGTITLYNGPEGCPTSTLTGPQGSQITYKNPWIFIPGNAPGSKWTYTPNVNNYLFVVVYEEFEAHRAVVE